MDKNAVRQRNQQICEMRHQGLPLREIGEKTGISKERVRQVLKRKWGSTRYEWVTTKQLCEDIGITRDRLKNFQDSGVIKPVVSWSAGKIRYSLWSPSVADDISKQNVCVTCHGPLPKDRPKYCSDRCRRKRWEYRNRTPEEKRRMLESIRRYRERQQVTDTTLTENY